MRIKRLNHKTKQELNRVLSDYLIGKSNLDKYQSRA